MADCTESKEDSNAPRLPAVMELDAVDESSENSANDDLEDQSCEENSRPKVMHLRKFYEGSNSIKMSSFPPSILRPSQLGGFSFNTSNSTTTPSTSGPLEKKTNQNDSDENNEDINNDNDKNTKNDEKNNKNEDDENSDDKKLTPLKFLPLLSNVKEHDNNTNNSMTSKTSVSGFVFGQNFNERATVAKNDKNDDHNNDSDVKKNSDDADDNNTIKNNIIDNDKVVDNDDDDNNDADGGDGSSGGGNSAGDDDKNKDKDENNDEKKVNENGGLFSTAATALRTTSRPGITLSQAAQEVEEANRANKRKYNEVALKTGEEDEINVLQINNAILFTFDKETKGWKERGRGPLRLNDRDEESRLIGRISGTQRLMLNTKIWPGMTAELPGAKSLRITAMDIPDDKVSGDIRIFLVQAAPKEVDELHELLIQRIQRAKERQPKKIATGV
ncbi:hypothetical protein HCN44_003183 [Aphidius gifuensis]|uniref:RanBD1 domain-containing protein n=1 Tax=Aphidius gifuensis TaxID=684658 RepID=A0A834XMG3_APHGI|nr:uncharacterized protein DDB_G0287625 [Aphidius gifuensis]KAF7987421.1 hypothetical protein HCN44_003183 [Aphidius gifuensis]